MRYLWAFVRFWYEFVVGDDWRIAAGVVTVLAVGAGVVASGNGSGGLAVALYGALIVVFALPILAAGRHRGP